MTHPILQLQAMLVGALNADDELIELIGEDAVFDAPPKGRKPPYLVVARHDVRPRDGDAAPGHEHRVVLHAWAAEASRKAALAIAEPAIAVATGPLSGDLLVTHRVHERTETLIDQGTGFARAAVTLRYLTEAG
jgi:hypothetical protein